MLILCPECELKISDKANFCPHCGYPMKTNIVNRSVRSNSNKRRRLPNGFGQISEIKNRNLRNPFRAMITIGKNAEGRPICKPLKPISYFKTYNDAYYALMEYNKHPYELDSLITMEELFNQWFDYKKENITVSTSNSIVDAWVYCKPLYNLLVRNIRTVHIKKCIDEASREFSNQIKPASAAMKERIKILLNQLLDYAVEFELTDKNYARQFKLSEKIVNESRTPKKKHISYTDDEIKLLWNNINKKKFVDIIIYQCYSGWRPGELCEIKTNNIFIDQGYIIGGLKTKNGTNRVVPIHPAVKNIIEKWYKNAIDNNREYLFCSGDNKKYTYSMLKGSYEKLINELNISQEHRLHDGRKHFITLAKKYKLDEYAIKYIVGHSISDITERVYTDREILWLIDEMKKIK